MLEKNLWNSLLLYLVVEILKLAHEIRCSRKEVFWKTSHNSQINTKSSHPEVFSQKMFLKIHIKNIFARVSILTKLQAGNLKLAEAAAGDLSQSIKQVVLKNFANIWGPATLLKKTPTQVFSCEIYKVFKNYYFEEHLWMFASKH